MNPNTLTRIQNIGRLLLGLTRELFRILLVGYFIFLVMDQLIPGFASYQVNETAWLWAVIITGLITAIFDRASNPELITPTAQPSKASQIVLIIIGLVGAGLVYSKLPSLGSIRIIASIIAAVLIYLLGNILLASDQSQP